MNPQPQAPLADEAEPLRRQLAGLVDPAPPEHLWQRIERSGRRRRQRRWLLRGGAGVLLLAALGVWLPREWSANAPPSRSELAAAPMVAPPLAAIDRQLQEAYDRGLDPRVIERLWQQRARLAQTASWQHRKEDSDVAIIEL